MLETYIVPHAGCVSTISNLRTVWGKSDVRKSDCFMLETSELEEGCYGKRPGWVGDHALKSYLDGIEKFSSQLSCEVLEEP